MLKRSHEDEKMRKMQTVIFFIYFPLWFITKVELDFSLAERNSRLTWFMRGGRGCLLMTSWTIVFQIRVRLLPRAVTTKRTGSDRFVTSCSAYREPSGRMLNLGSLLLKLIQSFRWQASNVTKQNKQTEWGVRVIIVEKLWILIALSYKTADGLLSDIKLEHLVFIAVKRIRNNMTEFDKSVGLGIKTCQWARLIKQTNKQTKRRK